MDFVIQLLKDKKKEIENEYKNETDLVKRYACIIMTEQLDKAIKTLDYEFYFKHLNEKQSTELIKLRTTK